MNSINRIRACSYDQVCQETRLGGMNISVFISVIVSVIFIPPKLPGFYMVV